MKLSGFWKNSSMLRSLCASLWFSNGNFLCFCFSWDYPYSTSNYQLQKKYNDSKINDGSQKQKEHLIRKMLRSWHIQSLVSSRSRNSRPPFKSLIEIRSGKLFTRFSVKMMRDNQHLKQASTNVNLRIDKVKSKINLILNWVKVLLDGLGLSRNEVANIALTRMRVKIVIKKILMRAGSS